MGENQVVTLGPLTIMYIKEGYIGGAYSRKEGQFNLLFPGPPYVLNSKDYEKPVCVKRSDTTFKVGPITFVTVCKGQLGAATHIQSGKTQYLYPGSTYQLHDKDFSAIKVVDRSKNFELGSCYFVTVEEGFYCGAVNKKTGKFEQFEPGRTYQLSKEFYEAPVTAKANGHVVYCGHVTFVTPREDLLIGAYQRSTGTFVQFKEATVIHQKDYYGLEQVNKYSDKQQKFGPYVVITIEGGTCGVFTKGGKLEIKEAGWYMLSADYVYVSSIPLKTFPTTISVEFTTKDGVKMSVSVTVVWSVNDPNNVAVYPGGFPQIQKDIEARSKLIMSKLCRSYNRDQILPTKQDVIMKSGVDIEEEKIAAMLIASDRETAELHHRIESLLSEQLSSALTTAKTGSEIKSVRLENFELTDAAIRDDLHKITQAIVETNRQKVESEKALREAQNKAKIIQEQARAEANVAIEKARASAEVEKERERGAGDVRREKARADAEVEKQQATAAAEAERIRVAAKNELLVAEAEASATATKVKAEAEYIERVRAMEAAAMMSKQQLQLELADREVKLAEAFGNAAWRHPNQLTDVLERFGARVRFPDMVDLLATGSGGPPPSGPAPDAAVSLRRSSSLKNAGLSVVAGTR